MKNELVRVFLWNHDVGCLRWDERKALAYFVFSQDFLSLGLNISPILVPAGDVKSRFPIAGDKRKIYCGLPPFIADSLPDNWGSMVFEQWAISRGMKSNSITPLDKLAFIGKRAMGALEFRPEAERGESKELIMIDELASLAEKIHSRRAELSISPDESLTLQSLFEVGTSAGGRQPKAIIAINNKTGEIRSGQVPHQEGYDYYILKFAVHDGYPATEMEMTYYDLAVKAGLDMMPSRLLEVEGGEHFLTMRFDRKQGKKRFTQTLAAINPEVDSYEGLFKTCRRLCVPESEIRELYRQTVFNHLASNTDDHNKNFSFVMEEDGSWHLAPPYDITFTADLQCAGARHLHCLSLCGKLDGVTVKDLMFFAKEMCVKNASEIIDQVCMAIVGFRQIALKNHVPLVWMDRIEEYLQSLMPETYRDAMSGWRPVELSSMLDGQSVENIHFEMSPSGNIHLCALVDGEERKYVFNQKRREYFDILNKGYNTMPDEEKIKYAAQFLIKTHER